MEQSQQELLSELRARLRTPAVPSAGEPQSTPTADVRQVTVTSEEYDLLQSFRRQHQQASAAPSRVGTAEQLRSVAVDLDPRLSGHEESKSQAVGPQDDTSRRESSVTPIDKLGIKKLGDNKECGYTKLEAKVFRDAVKHIRDAIKNNPYQLLSRLTGIPYHIALHVLTTESEKSEAERLTNAQVFDKILDTLVEQAPEGLDTAMLRAQMRDMKQSASGESGTVPEFLKGFMEKAQQLRAHDSGEMAEQFLCETYISNLFPEVQKLVRAQYMAGNCKTFEQVTLVSQKAESHLRLDGAHYMDKLAADRKKHKDTSSAKQAESAHSNRSTWRRQANNAKRTEWPICTRCGFNMRGDPHRCPPDPSIWRLDRAEKERERQAQSQHGTINLAQLAAMMARTQAHASQQGQPALPAPVQHPALTDGTQQGAPADPPDITERDIQAMFAQHSLRDSSRREGHAAVFVQSARGGAGRLTYTAVAIIDQCHQAHPLVLTIDGGADSDYIDERTYQHLKARGCVTYELPLNESLAGVGTELATQANPIVCCVGLKVQFINGVQVPLCWRVACSTNGKVLLGTSSQRLLGMTINHMMQQGTIARSRIALNTSNP